MIDVLSLIQQQANIQIDGRPTNSRDGKEYHSNCPFCGGKNRFAIWPDAGRWSCSLRSSGCGKRGDAIEFLREFENMSYKEACNFLEVDSRYPEEWRIAPALPLFMTRDEEPCKQWQSSAEAFLWRSERYLWSGKCENVLRYLHSRGFTDETLKKARIGYCPGWYSDALSNWGLTSLQTDNQPEIKIPEGIVIPWLVSSAIWKLSIRRPDKQYFQVLGSSDALYNIDAFKSDQPVMLLEGEFDALSVQQEASDLITPIATGGTVKGMSARWIAQLLRASTVLIGFDQDDNRSGDTGSQDWLNVLPNSLRWTPWAKDANDMLRTGLPIRLWVDMGLRLESIPEPMTESLQANPVTPALIIPQPLLSRPTWLSAPTNDRGLPKRCTCGRPAIGWAAQCRPYCERCWSHRSIM